MDARKREQFWRHQRGLFGPNWRIKAAQELRASSLHVATQTWDSLTIETAKYFALRAEAPNGFECAAAAYPTIEAAFNLHDDTTKTDVIKLMILADLSVQTIAERAGVDANVVDIWEPLFFDVRSSLSCIGWLSVQVLEKERQTGKTALAARMKLALAAGVEGVNAMLAMEKGAPVDEAEKLFERKMKLHLKFDEAADFPIDSDRSRMNFIKLHSELMLTEQRLKSAEKELATRCVEARARYELVKMRRENAQERAAAKAHEKEQKAEQRRWAEEERKMEAARAQEQLDQVRLAELQAAKIRAAQSPLARLTWGKPASESTTTPASISLLDHGKQVELASGPTNRKQMFDANVYPHDAETTTPIRDVA